MYNLSLILDFIICWSLRLKDILYCSGWPWGASIRSSGGLMPRSFVFIRVCQVIFADRCCTPPTFLSLLQKSRACLSDPRYFFRMRRIRLGTLQLKLPFLSVIDVFHCHNDAPASKLDLAPEFPHSKSIYP